MLIAKLTDGLMGELMGAFEVVLPDIPSVDEAEGENLVLRELLQNTDLFGSADEIDMNGVDGEAEGKVLVVAESAEVCCEN